MILETAIISLTVTVVASLAFADRIHKRDVAERTASAKREAEELAELMRKPEDPQVAATSEWFLTECFFGASVTGMKKHTGLWFMSLVIGGIGFALPGQLGFWMNLAGAFLVVVALFLANYAGHLKASAGEDW